MEAARRRCSSDDASVQTFSVRQPVSMWSGNRRRRQAIHLLHTMAIATASFCPNLLLARLPITCSVEGMWPASFSPLPLTTASNQRSHGIRPPPSQMCLQAWTREADHMAMISAPHTQYRALDVEPNCRSK